MNIQYLGNHAIRLNSLEEIKDEGNIYVVGRNKDAFIAFRLPKKEKIKKNYIQIKTSEGLKKECDEIVIKDITIYEAILNSDGSKIEQGYSKKNREIVLDQTIDVEHMGVFQPTRGSRLKSTLEEKLPKK